MNIDKLVRRVLLEVDETGKNVTQKININDPKSVLQHAISTPSCFPSKGYAISEMRVATTDLATACGVSEKTNYSVGTTGTTTVYFFGTKDTATNPNPDSNGLTHFQLCATPDGGKTYIKVNSGRTWGCKDAFAELEDINKFNLSPEQEIQLKKYVDSIGGVYSAFKPEGYTEQEFNKYDVKTIPVLDDTFVDFPNGKMFIWVRKGLLNATPDQLLELKNAIGNLNPKLTTDIPKTMTERVSYCVNAKGLFPTTDYMPPGIDYEALKVRVDDPNSGLKRGQYTLFCPDSASLNEVKKSANDMNKCRQSVKFLYACKTNPRRANKVAKGKPSDSGTQVDGNKCEDFKTVFYNRYLTYVCNSKSFKMYDRTVDILGVGIKKEVNDLISDYTTDFGIGTFQQGLRESVKISNTLDYTINKFVLEAIKGKKRKLVDPIGYTVKKNLLEEFKRRRK